MKVISFNNENLTEAVKIAVKFIKDGKVLVCPTDTVYGLVCDATNKEAVEKIYEIKRRPKEKPLPIFVKDIEMAKGLAEIDKNQESFLKNVWPGNTTVILTRKKIDFDLFGVDKNTLGMRVPKYQPVLDLISKLELPLAETSVNISGEPAMTKISEIINFFMDNETGPDLIIDAGDLEKTKPSQVVDLTSKKPRIIRE
jgi:L-threonylcarbamoyladenylate synthase